MPELKSPTTVAAIDVGSSSIRMDISEIHPEGSIRILESLSKGVSLGKDTFDTGHLSEETLQTACESLSDFSEVMKTYAVTDYRAVATSAVREASNADTFLDRVFMRSGIEVEVIDGSEENRLTYLAIHEAMDGLVDLQTKNTLVVEVGGGSTDISFLQQGITQYSGTFALGSIRMKQALMEVGGELKQRVKLLERQIANTINTIAINIPFSKVEELIALGGDMRLAARQIAPDQENPWVFGRKEFTKFCSEISRYDLDELTRRYSLSYTQAETLVPALLANRSIIEKTKVDRVHVFIASIRAGLILDMALRKLGKGPESFEKQIVASARGIAQKYHANEVHIEQVRQLSLSLFDQLKDEHGLTAKERLLLEVAALLHDVGSFISTRSHHKHTQYIISSSEIFGLSRQELNLISNIARYHRKSPPTRAHAAYVSLDRDSRMVVSKLAAILRVADALEQDDSKKVRNLRITREEQNDRYVLEVEAEGDLTMEKLSLERKGDLFIEIYGKPIVLRQVEKLE
jgi:exopolyphosphatase/guanosine-5'-triphosphate,3'-diphosphate pyrophosphatase